MGGLFDKQRWEKKYINAVFLVKPEGKKLLAKPKGRCNDNETGS